MDDLWPVDEATFLRRVREFFDASRPPDHTDEGPPELEGTAIHVDIFDVLEAAEQESVPPADTNGSSPAAEDLADDSSPAAEDITDEESDEESPDDGAALTESVPPPEGPAEPSVTRKLALLILPVIALAAIGNVVLSTKTPDAPAPQPSALQPAAPQTTNCDALKFALHEAMTGFAAITGAQTTVPYQSGGVSATDYTTTFKFPSSDSCGITRYARQSAAVSCSFQSMSGVRQQVESCLVGLQGGWTNVSTYNSTAFENPDKLKIVLDNSPYGSGYVTVWGKAAALSE